VNLRVDRLSCFSEENLPASTLRSGGLFPCGGADGGLCPIFLSRRRAQWTRSLKWRTAATPPAQWTDQAGKRWPHPGAGRPDRAHDMPGLSLRLRPVGEQTLLRLLPWREGLAGRRPGI